MTTAATPRQQEVLRFLAGYSYTNGYPPTQREIADGLGINISTVNQHLADLADRGLVRRDPNKARGYSPMSTCPTCGRAMQPEVEAA